MARPRVADGRMASSMEASWEYIEQAVVDTQKRVVCPPVWGMGEELKILTFTTYLFRNFHTENHDTRKDYLVRLKQRK